MAIFHSAQLIQVNFAELSLNWLHMSFDENDLHTLHNTASNDPVRPHLVNGDHLWSKVWSMNDLVLIEAKVRNLGLRYQVMTGKEFWGNIERIWANVA